MLETPRRYFYLPDHVSPFPPFSPTEWLQLALHLVSFVPVGFLLVWGRRRSTRRSTDVLVAGAVALGLALVLAAGKLLFSERHLAVSDLVVQTVGAVAGAYAAARWCAARSSSADRSRRREAVITERRTYDEIR